MSEDMGLVTPLATPSVVSRELANEPATPSGIFVNAVASLTALLWAMAGFTAAFWLLDLSWALPFPWGAGLIPLMAVSGMVGVGGTIAIFSVWTAEAGGATK